jgi:hypothetical protein
MFWQEQTTPREGPSNREKKEQTPCQKNDYPEQSMK